jgi:tetratricopeptide (TPR) repeat protein
MKSKSIFWLIILAFFVDYSFGQDLLLGEDEQESTEESNCIPTDLSVSYDVYAGTISDPLEVKKLYSFGSEYHKNKNYASAIPLLWKVFLNDSDRTGNLSIGKIAESYFYEKKIDSTLIACYRGLEKYPQEDNQKLHYYAGYLQKELGKSACAIPHYDAMVAKNPDNVPYLTTLAFLLYKVKDSRSIEVQRKVVELSPDDPKVQEALATYMQAFGESPRLAWKEAWEKDNSNQNAALNYGRFSIEEGFYKDAISPLSSLIAAKPSDKDGYRYRAISYENLGQNSNAIKDLEAWLKLDPDNVDIMLYIASNYSVNKRFSTANDWINRAINKKPGYGKPFIVRGEMYEAMVAACQGDKTKLEDKIVYEEAIAVYEMAKRDPGFISIASTKINNLMSFIRTPDERFMEPNANVENPCYEFLVGKKGK